MVPEDQQSMVGVGDLEEVGAGHLAPQKVTCLDIMTEV